MEGNPVAKESDNAVEYALRLTFGIVHGTLLTLVGLCLAFLIPSFSHFLFSLYGCIIAPLISFILTIFCNACVEYVSGAGTSIGKAHKEQFITRVLHSSWIPPLGVFCVSLLILPLEMMPSLGFQGPINTLVATSICMNFVVSVLLQIYSARRVQSSDDDATRRVQSSSEDAAPAPTPATVSAPGGSFP
jgi:hypothetical protein